MKKFGMVAGLGLLVLSGLAVAQPTNETRRHGGGDINRQQVIERTAQRFERLDVNRDGRLTAEEARRARGQRREQRAGLAFDRLDLDRNGNVTRAEFEQARGQMREQRGERRGGRFMRGARGGQTMRTGRMFGEQGFITREQFQQRALVRFDRQDIDRDGTVTVAERRQSFQQRREQREQSRD